MSRMYSRKLIQSPQEQMSIDFPAYTGKNEHIILLKNELQSIRRHLAGAFVHGSFATGEEISYSDFDGLIILSQSTLADEKQLSEVAFTLHTLRRYMHRIDPFQHHGWFVLAESDLENYPEWFLPVAVLKHSRSLLGEMSLLLRVQEKPDVDFRKSFFRFCESLQRKLSDRHRN